ncbi:MAG: ATP-binding protein [Bacilli bacterium]|nr:ATP-binding protein [Bacilli bacterium]
MLGNIYEIDGNSVYVKLSIDINNQANLVNLHAVFEDGDKKVVGEIVSATLEKLIINIVGEIRDIFFYPGVSTKPSFKSKVRLITLDELQLILGKQKPSSTEFYLGVSNIYKNYRINVDINNFFSNHFAILGNSGSGKSYAVAGMFQRLFQGPNPPINSNIFIFDAYGEYTKVFDNLHNMNPKLSYKTYTTNTNYEDTDILRIPLWLLDVDDLALLLDATTPTQLPIIEKTLKLVKILTGSRKEVKDHKNDIIARALLDILVSGLDSTKIRDQVIAILTKFNTEDLNLECKIVQPGYVRTFKQCLIIDKSGKMQEMELVVDFIKSFINDELEYKDDPNDKILYTLSDLEEAMEFALISEGSLKSEKVFDYANILSVRLHTLANSASKEYFSYPKYVTRGEYIYDLTNDKKNFTHAQVVNFNINYVDDRLAKVITKIISKLLFNQAVNNTDRGSVPYHIVIEEAHRYVQNDNDVNIIGYNIFDRITKEGRKYGVLLGLITQRPSELSDTAISQCSNFIIFRTLHPRDIEYIKNMVPNISQEVMEQAKNLKPGNCVAFGSAFRVPTSLYVEKPNPAPLSSNVDVSSVWQKEVQTNQPVDTNTIKSNVEEIVV